MFIGLRNFADDLGRMALSAKTIKAQIFPSDDVSSENILGMIDELSKNGLVLIYSVDDRNYIQIVGWQHQRIDKPQPGKCPGPINGYSKNIPGMVATEGKVEERKVEESNSEAIASDAFASDDPSVAEREFFKRGREVLGKSAGGLLAKLKASRGHNVALARAALETASQKENPAEYVAAVIRGPPAVKATTVHQQRQQESREVLNAMREFNAGAGGRADSGVLRLDTGDESASFRGGAGRNLIELSPSRDRSRG
jgi:hypothetical protein